MSREKRSNGLSILLTFILGALTGAILSLLYAPTAGRDARRKIRDTSVDAKTKTVGVAHKTSERAKDTLHHLVDQGKAKIHDTKDGVKSAVDAGKKAFSEKKAEIAEVISRQDSIGGNDGHETVVAEIADEITRNVVVESNGDATPDESDDDAAESDEDAAS